jgi:hypothetical protein
MGGRCLHEVGKEKLKRNDSECVKIHESLRWGSDENSLG